MLKVTPSYPTITKYINQGRNKYTSPIDPDKPVKCAVNNIGISKTVHLLTDDSTYYHGTNQIEYQPDLHIPETQSSTARLQIKDITDTFIQPKEHEKFLLDEFKWITAIGTP